VREVGGLRGRATCLESGAWWEEWACAWLPWCVELCCEREVAEVGGSSGVCVGRMRSEVSDGRRDGVQLMYKYMSGVDSRIEAQLCFDFDMCCGQSSSSKRR